ncbi:hypothetical protein ACFWXK_13425 [Streptomyces sp. NPDC059070]|uniref:hypothetical protein n=1 Tax=unclassified Streptomyces TaxID=2593676 RepID=UPI0034E1E7D2
MGRVLGRMGRCAATYLLLHTIAWVAIALTVPWEESFLDTMVTGWEMLPFIGIPTLLISVCTVSVHRRMDVVRLRILLGLALLLCEWPLLASSAAEPLRFQTIAQIAYAALIPAPLFPEDWLGPRSR